MANILDDYGKMKRLDESGMLECLRRFPDDCEKSIALAGKVPLDKLEGREYDAVVFLGIGGSAIGGALIRDWLLEEAQVPMTVSRGRRIPGFVDEATLVFAISYSGNTEETLAACSEALKRGSTVVVLTSGGLLGEIAEEKCLTLLRMPGGMKPRAAIPYQFFMLSTTLNRIGLIPESWSEVEEAMEVLRGLRNEMVPEVTAEVNPAKRLAATLLNKIPFIYGPRLLESASYRFSTQLMENGKALAAGGTYPEAFHNAVVASEAPADVLNSMALLVIHGSGDLGRTGKKIQKFRELFRGVRVKHVLEAKGVGKLARILSVIYTGDFTSTYLAFLNGHDPGSNKAIDELKRV
jgi:glucose/mannose-6-phosphate isomerase